MTKQKSTKKNHDAKNTLSGFVTYLYRNDALISNRKALNAVKKRFPKCRTTMRSLSAIRSRLRKKGLRIPYQREGVGKFFTQKYLKDTSTPVLGDENGQVVMPDKTT